MLVVVVVAAFVMLVVPGEIGIIPVLSAHLIIVRSNNYETRALIVVLYFCNASFWWRPSGFCKVQFSGNVIRDLSWLRHHDSESRSLASCQQQQIQQVLAPTPCSDTYNAPLRLVSSLAPLLPRALVRLREAFVVVIALPLLSSFATRDVSPGC
jgi:hypothetical protein